MLDNLLGILDTGVNILNYGHQREAYEYQKSLNNLQMTREDSAWQRAVADAEKAGISKAALSSGASSNPLSAGAAPSMKADFQQRMINNLSMSQMRTQNDKLQSEAALAQAQLDAFNQTKASDIAAKNAQNAWITTHAGEAVAGYPSPWNAVTAAVTRFLENGGLSKFGVSGSKAEAIVEEVKTAISEAQAVINEAGAGATSKLNGTYAAEKTAERKAAAYERYATEPIDSYNRMIARRAEDYKYGNYISTGGR